MKNRFFVSAVSILIVIMAMPSSAFDGKRKGFMLGGGLGFGSTSFKQTVEIGSLSNTTRTLTKGAVITAWKIGYASSEQLEFHYSAKLTWFPIINIYDEQVLILNGAETFGITYNFSSRVPTFFVSGGIGFSSWEVAFSSPASDAWVGFGAFAGCGCEFARHYSIELDLAYGNPADSDSTMHVRTDAMSVMLKFNALAY